MKYKCGNKIHIYDLKYLGHFILGDDDTENSTA